MMNREKIKNPVIPAKSGVLFCKVQQIGKFLPDTVLRLSRKRFDLLHF
ncbi:MAG: hypothetical protein V2I97_15340 [Desulfococcaceae bacterium]|nr:hypothetical protein [Desulfococcaceae bacterium]